jgi:hypothetical protein
MQIPPGQAALPPNPVTPTAALPQVERAQMAEPARKVTASREGAEGRSRVRAAGAAPPRRRGQTLDLTV